MSIKRGERSPKARKKGWQPPTRIHFCAMAEKRGERPNENEARMGALTGDVGA